MTRADILIAEDSPTQAEHLRTLLEAHDYAVRVTRDGAAALSAAQAREPDLLITDVMMPRMDGYELCAQIKSAPDLHEIPVILLTSLAQPEDVIRSLHCGADNFVRKPYDEHYLLSRVSNILSSRRLRRVDGPEVGLEVNLAGDRHFINADRQQILDFLLSTYEEVREVNAELERRSAQLESRNAELETALRRLEAEQRRSQELASVNRAVLDATAEGIVLVDTQGRNVLANAEFERMLEPIPGMSTDATLTQNVRSALNVVGDPEAVQAFAEGLLANPDSRRRIDVDLPDLGTSMEVFSAPVRNDAGERLGRIVAVRDVTREREVERLKSELVATVSHELRSPLTSVLGFAELLALRDLDEVQRHQYVETIATEARRLSSLVDDFLDLHRIEEGHFAVQLRPLDLREILTSQVRTCSVQTVAHEVVVDVPDSPLDITGESDRLVQVVANLLSNAIRYSPHGGRIEVEGRRRNGDVEVLVRDEGVGIPRDQQPKIFTKFFRVEAPETRSIRGTGLGLALCREIVEAHGGEMGFESAPGEGSTFWFRLPAADATELEVPRDGLRPATTFRRTPLIPAEPPPDGAAARRALSGPAVRPSPPPRRGRGAGPGAATRQR